MLKFTENASLVKKRQEAVVAYQKDLTLNSLPFTIGRQQNSDLVITEIGISRVHCVINKDKSNWFIEDLSNNGVRVNEQLLGKGNRRKLCNEDQIKLAENFSYTFLMPHGTTDLKKPLSSSNPNSIENNTVKGYVPESALKKLAAEEAESKASLELQHKKDIETLNQTIKSLRLELESLLKVSEMKDLNLEKSETAIKRLEQELESVRNFSKMKDRDLKSSETVINKLEQKCEGQQQKLDSIESSLLTLKCDFQTKEIECNSLSKSEDNLKRERVNLEKIRDDWAAERPKLEFQLVQAKVDQNHALESQLQRFEGLMESEVPCAICLEIVIDARTVNCGHSFCAKCIEDWQKKKPPQCPTCRAKITHSSRSAMLDSFILKMVENLTGEFKHRRNQALEERSGPKLGPPAPKRRKLKQPLLPYLNQAVPEPEVYIDLTTSF